MHNPLGMNISRFSISVQLIVIYYADDLTFFFEKDEKPITGRHVKKTEMFRPTIEF